MRTGGEPSSHYVLIEVQKGAQCTSQAKMVIGSSYTPNVMSTSGTVHPIVDCIKFTRAKT